MSMAVLRWAILLNPYETVAWRQGQLYLIRARWAAGRFGRHVGRSTFPDDYRHSELLHRR